MPYNILVVDDSRTVRSVVRKVIALTDVPVENIFEAGNGKEALEVLARHWVDLVLADINMPVMNGIEMIEMMASDATLESIPVVVISTEGSITLVEQLKTKGVRAWLRKPFRVDLVRSVIKEALESSRENVRDLSTQSDQMSVVCRTFAEVLEKTASMSADAVPVMALPTPNERCLRGGITFTGVVAGDIVLAMPESMCQEMAANILGCESGDASASEQSGDALKEVISVTCGNVLAALVGLGSRCSMRSSEIESLSKEGWVALTKDPHSVGFRIGQDPVLLNFVLMTTN